MKDLVCFARTVNLLLSAKQLEMSLQSLHKAHMAHVSAAHWHVGLVNLTEVI